jgi:hypothetical protein
MITIKYGGNQNVRTNMIIVDLDAVTFVRPTFVRLTFVRLTFVRLSDHNICLTLCGTVDLNQIVFSLFQYYFYLPILVLLSVNTLLFVLTIIKLWLHAKSVRLATRGSVTSEVKIKVCQFMLDNC